MIRGGQAADISVMMYDGSVRGIQDIIRGDKLMGDDNTSRTVLNVVKGRDVMVKIVPRSPDWKPFAVSKTCRMCLQFSIPPERWYSSTSEKAEVMVGTHEPGKTHPDKYMLTFGNIEEAQAAGWIPHTSESEKLDGEVFVITPKRLQLWNPKWYIGGRICVYRAQNDPYRKHQQGWRSGFYMQDMPSGDFIGLCLDGNGRYLKDDYTILQGQ